MSIVATVLILVVYSIVANVFGFQGANITNGESYYAFIEAEDHTFYTYLTINGSSERLYGDNATLAMQNLLRSKFGDMIEEQILNKSLAEKETLLQIQREYITNTKVMLQLTQAIKYLTVTLKEIFTSVALNFHTQVYATGVSIDGVQISGNPSVDKNTQVLFNATFANGTKALYVGNETADKTNLMIALINGILESTIDTDELGKLVPTEIPKTEEEPIEESKEEEESGSGGTGGEGGNSNDNDNDNGNSPPSNEGTESEDGTTEEQQQQQQQQQQEQEQAENATYTTPYECGSPPRGCEPFDL
jgi:hypothetical protein